MPYSHYIARYFCFFCSCQPLHEPVLKNPDVIQSTAVVVAKYEDTIPFVPPIQGGWVIKVYDGDTITIANRLPYPESPLYRFQVRLAGIDCPEIRGGSLHEKVLAMECRDHLHGLIYNQWVNLRNVKTEKYGRILAEVYLGKLHINQWLLDQKMAIPYHGGKKNCPAHWSGPV